MKTRSVVILSIAAACLLAVALNSQLDATDHPPSATGARSSDGDLIPAERLGNSDYCGHCHTDVFHQWNASSHHFSSFNNPVYRRVAIATAHRHGDGTLQFCGSCHDPVALLAGELSAANDNTWSANAGITCLGCHRITKEHGGNGAYTISEPTLHPFALSDNPTLRRLHQMLLSFTPGLHRTVLSKPLHGTPEFCASCHTVTSPASVNGRRDLLLQDEHGQWARSRYATGAPQERKQCIDCHMPLVPSTDPAAKKGYIRSHRFVGGNTLTPQLNRDGAQFAATERFLRSGVISLRCAVEQDSDGALSDCDRARLSAHKPTQLRVEIANVGVGHNFPAGTSDSNESWVEVEVLDSRGVLVLHRGGVDANGNIQGDPLFFRTIYHNAHGEEVDRRTATTEAIARVQDTTIPAGEARHYVIDFAAPAATAFPLKIRVRLNWRKYNPDMLKWVFGERERVQAPITVMADLRAIVSTSSPR